MSNYYYSRYHEQFISSLRGWHRRHREQSAFCSAWRSSFFLYSGKKNGLPRRSLHSLLAMTAGCWIVSIIARPTLSAMAIATRTLRNDEGIRRWIRLLFPILIILLLVGCGFTTQGLYELPLGLKKIYYSSSSPYAPFNVAMIKRLKANQVTLLQRPEKNALILHLSHNYSHSKEEQMNSAQARICTLDYTATLTIDDFYGNHIIGLNTITVSRSIILQPNEVFESTPQISTVKNELQEELINRIFNILISSKTELATQHWAHED